MRSAEPPIWCLRQSNHFLNKSGIMKRCQSNNIDIYYHEMVALWGKLVIWDWIIGGHIVRPSLRDRSY